MQTPAELIGNTIFTHPVALLLLFRVCVCVCIRVRVRAFFMVLVHQ
jgi:hypothetical protein